MVEVPTDENNRHGGSHCWSRTLRPYHCTAGTVDLIIHCGGGFPVHSKTHSSIPGPHLLDDRSTPSPQEMTTRNILKLCPGKEALAWELKATPQGLAGSWGCVLSPGLQFCVFLSVNPVSAQLAVVFTQTRTYRVIYHLSLGEAIKTYGR